MFLGKKFFRKKRIARILGMYKMFFFKTDLLVLEIRKKLFALTMVARATI